MELCKMNILITGGAGYIGSHVVKQLGELTDHRITTLDNLSTGNKDAVLYGEFIEEDLANFSEIEKIFKVKNFDAVMHFAGSIVVPESVVNPMKYYMNNTVNTASLLNLCNIYRVKKFIFSSTAAVYGEPENKNVNIGELTKTAPINPYGMTKLMIECIIKDLGFANPNFKYVILRYFNVAGADLDGRIGQDFPDATHLIKVAAQTVCGMRDKIYIFGDDYNTEDGTCIRDYIHVDDLSSAHLSALKYLDNNNSDIFNCGYGYGFSVKEVIDTMKKVSGKDFQVEITGKRAGDPAQLVSDNNKIISKMHWKPQYDNLEVICKTALDWEKKCNA